MSVNRRMRSYLRKLVSFYFPDRSSGFDSETDFWREWLQTRAMGKEDKFSFRLDPEAPVQPYYAHLIDKIPRENIDVLDVGAGPLTTIGKVHPGKRLTITAVDPLADTYQALLDETGLQPPAVTIKCAGEDLTRFFKDRRFDLVFAENALDHAEDPVKIIGEMIALCRPHGIVSLVHFAMEGDLQSYRGLHTWNFSLRDEDLMILGRNYTRNVHEIYPHMNFVSTQEDRLIRTYGIKP